MAKAKTMRTLPPVSRKIAIALRRSFKAYTAIRLRSVRCSWGHRITKSFVSDDWLNVHWEFENGISHDAGVTPVEIRLLSSEIIAIHWWADSRVLWTMWAETEGGRNQLAHMQAVIEQG